MSRFDVLLIILIIFIVIGWPTGFAGARLPSTLVTVAGIVILLVLLLLGVVRY